MFVIQTNRLIPERFDAYVIGPFVLVRPGKATPGLIAHEREHVVQWLVATIYGTAASLILCQIDAVYALGLMLQIFSPFIHPFLYAESWRYRRWAEVEGHRADIASGEITMDDAINRIQSNYGLPELGAGYPEIRAMFFR